MVVHTLILQKLFQYATTAALNHEEIKINNCNWNRIKYPSKIDDWKHLRKTI